VFITLPPVGDKKNKVAQNIIVLNQPSKHSPKELYNLSSFKYNPKTQQCPTEMAYT